MLKGLNFKIIFLVILKNKEVKLLVLKFVIIFYILFTIIS